VIDTEHDTEDEPTPDDPAWVFDTKWDGFRMMAEIQNGSVTLYSRSGKILSEIFASRASA
jgi:bifunctional non-homologous end joining protein LigD